jgi:hypothetical protein
LGLSFNLWINQQEDQKTQHDQRQHPPHRGVGALGATQIVAVFEKKRTDPDAEGQAQQSQDGIAVAAGQPQHRPPRTSQKDQCPDHGKGAQNEADNGRRTHPGPEFLEQIGGNHRTDDEPDDLRTDVLDHAGPVQTQCTGHVAFETGHTDAHIPGVSQVLQQRCQNADGSSHADDSPTAGKKILHDVRVLLSAGFRWRLVMSINPISRNPDEVQFKI